MSHKLYRILIIFWIVIALFIVPVYWLVFSIDSNLKVNFLDIGQGDAIFINMPYGQNVLIDGGPDDKIISELNKVMFWWDKNIDLMILTHPHSDHVAGLIEVLKRYNVRKILYTGVVHSSPDYLAWLEMVKKKKIPVVIIDRSQVINFGEKCYFEILYPTESLLGKEVDNLNSSSIIIKLIYKDISFLFTGDAEIEVENELVEFASNFEIDKKIDLHADVFKAGHHGSDTSNSKSFLDLVKPEIVIIQSGKNNDFGHPSLRVIKRLERIGAKILRNDKLGTIRIFSDGVNIKY